MSAEQEDPSGPISSESPTEPEMSAVRSAPAERSFGEAARLRRPTKDEIQRAIAGTPTIEDRERPDIPVPSYLTRDPAGDGDRLVGTVSKDDRNLAGDGDRLAGTASKDDRDPAGDRDRRGAKDDRDPVGDGDRLVGAGAKDDLRPSDHDRAAGFTDEPSQDPTLRESALSAPVIVRPPARPSSNNAVLVMVAVGLAVVAATLVLMLR